MDKFKFDLGYAPENPLFEGVQAEEKDGRWSLESSQRSVDTIKMNARMLAHNTGAREAIITGPSAAWVYAAVTAAVANYFNSVEYQDGRGLSLTIAAK